MRFVSKVSFLFVLIGFVSLAYAGRFYDAQLGRWVEVDPADEFHSPYTYVKNNPLVFVDPNGEEVLIAISGIYQKNYSAIEIKDASSTTFQIANELTDWAGKQGITDFDALAIGGGWSDNSTIDMAVSFIKENMSSGEQLIIYGYSWGGDTAVELTNRLGQEGIDVSLLVTVDAAKGYLSGLVDKKIPKNVAENINYFQPKASGIGSHGTANVAASTSTKVLNIQFNYGGETTHANIDEQLKPVVINAMQNTLDPSKD